MHSFLTKLNIIQKQNNAFCKLKPEETIIPPGDTPIADKCTLYNRNRQLCEKHTDNMCAFTKDSGQPGYKGECTPK